MPARKKVAPEPLLHFRGDGTASISKSAAGSKSSLLSKATVNAFDTRTIPLPPNKPKAHAQALKAHEIPERELTQELKDDLQLVQMRNVLDKKRFYKSSDYRRGKLPTNVQVGTVVEGPTEFKSGRLKRKERRKNMVAEVMADADMRKYAKRKFLEVQHETQRGGKRVQNEKAKAKAPKWARARH
mmetsp:Transcript_18982/g.51041  ORF Transcript_18982/g.51041 Transcript_18982/m.51041 type:complete len:185 (+) Transcript_18982:59-613(+)|eukprot:CAMPEP_0185194294 /NCGR_PEP_ID=MMETSP1140-20130426/30264_1 /TAXON_ID=298111 /ORGANISM="Pavlova sp., Strain CCMP459" /LENGTH=184 /DNA_ID=CAMNT_0027761205 /DNA_START=27 /DNA_END=581 /DNA_ORIENTATION=-